jgi:hypothetical protein
MANSVHSGAIAGSAAWAATWLPTSGGEALHRLQARRMEDVRARCERFLASRPSLCAVQRLVSGGGAGHVFLDQAGRGWVDQISQADCALLLIALQRSSLNLHNSSQLTCPSCRCAAPVKLLPSRCPSPSPACNVASRASWSLRNAGSDAVAPACPPKMSRESASACTVQRQTPCLPLSRRGGWMRNNAPK